MRVARTFPGHLAFVRVRCCINLQLLPAQGAPFDTPVAQHERFVANSPAEVTQVFCAYRHLCVGDLSGMATCLGKGCVANGTILEAC